MVLAGVGLRAHEEVSEKHLWRCLHGQQVEVAQHVQPVVAELPGGHGVHADLGTGWPQVPARHYTLRSDHPESREDHQYLFCAGGAPLDDDMAYLVEAVDGYLDDNLKPLSYPPVHPHHSAVYVTGFPEKLAYNNPSSPFFGFNPIARLPLSSMNEQGKKSNGDDWLQTSTNTPGAHAASRLARPPSLNLLDGVTVPTQVSTTTCTAAIHN